MLANLSFYRKWREKTISNKKTIFGSKTIKLLVEKIKKRKTKIYESCLEYEQVYCFAIDVTER